MLGAERGRVLQEEPELGELVLEPGEEPGESLNVVGEVPVPPTLVVVEVADLAELEGGSRCFPLPLPLGSRRLHAQRARFSSPAPDRELSTETTEEKSGCFGPDVLNYLGRPDPWRLKLGPIPQF